METKDKELVKILVTETINSYIEYREEHIKHKARRNISLLERLENELKFKIDKLL